MDIQWMNDEITTEVLEQTWARRAAMLAEQEAVDDGGERLPVVLVRLGQEVYGLEAQYVFDARPLERITPVPRAPGWMAGVVNVRGRIYPVLDLAGFLGLPAASNGAGAYLVVVQSEALELALKVDDVLSVVALPVNRIREAGETLNIPVAVVRGMVQSDEDADLPPFLIILDLLQLLRDPQLIIHEELV
ncbi:MAG TPA: chemotaxis protein CheW [Anaerolineae bacterium]|nr:chemotaxis protein CheW [Anaerolineae bacterium]HQI85649.1 chemotaxis protein CheW [Anaerolineae bacterium]